MRRVSVGTIALVVGGSLLTVALAQSGGALPDGAKKVPGEMWRQKMSMKMGAMSMPARSQDVCLPKENPQQGSKPPGENCTVYDIQSSANKMAAKFRCTGKDAAEGAMQSEKRGNTLITDMTMRARGSEMNMHGEATNLGQACEFIDTSGVKLAMPAPVDTCARALKYAKFKEDPRYTGQDSSLFLPTGIAGLPAACAGNKKEIAAYCTAFQTQSGFLSVHTAGKRNATRVVNQNESAKLGGPEARKLIAAVPADDASLHSSAELCGLGKGKTAANALRAKLLAEAEAKNGWTFLIAEGADTKVAELQPIAKENCSGRAFTSASSKEYTALCSWYAPDLIAGRFDRARNTAWGERNDEAPPPGSGDTVSANAADEQSGGAQPENANPVNSAVNKTKKVLRGIFGR